MNDKALPKDNNPTNRIHKALEKRYEAKELNDANLRKRIQVMRLVAGYIRPVVEPTCRAAQDRIRNQATRHDPKDPDSERIWTICHTVLAVEKWCNDAEGVAQSFLNNPPRGRMDIGWSEWDEYMVWHDRREKELDVERSLLLENLATLVNAPRPWRLDTTMDAARERIGGGGEEGAETDVTEGGVGLRQVADIIAGADVDNARSLKKEWDKSSVTKPDPIGKDPRKRQRYLYKPTDILEYMKRLGQNLGMPEPLFLSRLRNVCRNPQ
ncbi:MAG: hypothetical protein AB1696_16565 [Planctomycetota bacterium]